MIFDEAILDLPVAQSDSNLVAFLRPIADEILERLSKRHTFMKQVQSAMVPLIEKGRLNIDEVARELAMSPRTLQRRLENEGTTFGAVLDETRRVAALEYLKNPRIAIAEAAFLLGFSEPSTFYRSFRRWTGDTPANYRRSVVDHS